MNWQKTPSLIPLVSPNHQGDQDRIETHYELDFLEKQEKKHKMFTYGSGRGEVMIGSCFFAAGAEGEKDNG